MERYVCKNHGMVIHFAIRAPLDSSFSDLTYSA